MYPCMTSELEIRGSYKVQNFLLLWLSTGARMTHVRLRYIIWRCSPEVKHIWIAILSGSMVRWLSVHGSSPCWGGHIVECLLIGVSKNNQSTELESIFPPPCTHIFLKWNSMQPWLPVVESCNILSWSMWIEASKVFVGETHQLHFLKHSCF